MTRTTAETLRDVIATLEKATGPDRMLDERIACTAHGWKLWRSKHGHWELTGPRGAKASTFGWSSACKFDPDTGKPNPHYDDEPLLADDAGVPDYTASLDAAMTLYDKRPDLISTDPRKVCIAALKAREANHD